MFRPNESVTQILLHLLKHGHLGRSGDSFGSLDLYSSKEPREGGRERKALGQVHDKD